MYLLHAFSLHEGNLQTFTGMGARGHTAFIERQTTVVQDRYTIGSLQRRRNEHEDGGEAQEVKGAEHQGILLALLLGEEVRRCQGRGKIVNKIREQAAPRSGEMRRRLCTLCKTVARGDVRAGAVILLGEKTMPLTWRLSAASPGVVSFGEQGNLPGSVVRASRWTGGGAPVLSRSPWTWDSEGRRLFQDNGRPGRI